MACLTINGRSYTLTEDELASITADLRALVANGSAHMDLSQTRYGQEVWISHGTVTTTTRN